MVDGLLELEVKMHDRLEGPRYVRESKMNESLRALQFCIFHQRSYVL